jgi:hypothetical protein
MTHDQAKKHEERAFDYLLKRYGWQIFTTPHFALIDGVAAMDNEITHVVEFKSRNESLSSMERLPQSLPLELLERFGYERSECPGYKE